MMAGGALASFILLFATCGAYAFDPEDVKKLKTTNKCVDCDLTKANLSRMNLRQANLSGANLTGANLSRADLSNSWLMVTNLTKANLTGANLSGATLDGATWIDGTACRDGSMGKCAR